MNQLQIFENELFKVSAKQEGEQILFDVEQVATNLGFTRMMNDKEYIRWERVNGYLPKFCPEVGKGDFIPESLVYKLAFKAQNDVAEKFQDWLAIEVIPSIRRTGSYENKPMSIEDMIITQAQSVKELKHDVAQLKTVVDNEVWLTERQKKDVQDSVSRRVFELKRKGHEAHFQTLYSALKRFFGVSKYDKIPRKDHQEAINFIKGWYPPVKKEFKESR